MSDALELQAFSLKELESIELNHDPDPDNPSIGFVGKIKQSTLERVYEMRQQQHRRSDIPACVIALGHISNHLVGLAEDIEVEMEQR
jgi:hypothetical protein